MTIPLIEIVGAPGAGKTSIADAVIRSGASVASPLILRRRFASKVPRVELRPFARLPLELGRRSRLLEFLFLKSVAQQLLREAPVAGREDQKEYLSLCSQLFGESRGPWKSKALAMQWWLEGFIDRINVESNTWKNVVYLDDEPLSYRLSMFDGVSRLSLIERYFELVPLPGGLVHLRTNHDDLLARVLTRRKQAFRHEGLSVQEISSDLRFASEVAEIASRNLKLRGVPVLELDSASSIVDNARKVRDMVADLSGAGSESINP